MKHVFADECCIEGRAGVIFCAVGLRWVPIWNGRREGFWVSAAIHDTVTLLEIFLCFGWGFGGGRQRMGGGVVFVRTVMEWSLVCVINMYQIIRYYVDICLNFNVQYIFFTCIIPYFAQSSE